MRFRNCVATLAVLATTLLSSGCCSLSGPSTCDGLGGPGLLAGIGNSLRGCACSRGCGDIYIGPWLSDPPACDSCSGCGITEPCGCGSVCDGGCDSYGSAARGFLGMPTLFGFIYGGGCCSDPLCGGCDGGFDPACGCEISCGHDLGCGIEVGCGHEAGCGCEAACGFEPGCGLPGGCGCGGHDIPFDQHEVIIEGAPRTVEGETSMSAPWPSPPRPVAKVPSRTRRIYDPNRR